MAETSLEHDLLPCPFCGGPPTTWEPFEGKWSIGCHNERCSIRPSTWATKLDATRIEELCEAWNKRVSQRGLIHDDAPRETLAGGRTT